MIKRGKFYLPPPRDSRNFKELFHWLIDSGAGRLVDEDGEPIGSWTPEHLANAISQIDVNHRGIEVRTVQLWFQNNKKGVSADNIRWLARIFGCNDPEAASEWYKELRDSQTKLAVDRRKQKNISSLNTLVAPNTLLPNISSEVIILPSVASRNKDAPRLRLGLNLASRSEALFSGGSPLSLPAFVLAGSVTLGFLAYIMGVHDVTYTPMVGLVKQVGFFWAPNWTILGMVLLPFYAFVLIYLLAFWKNEGRPKLMMDGSGFGNHDGWSRKIQSFTNLYWIVFFICFAVSFLLQWSGVYLRALLLGDVGSLMVDWTLIAVVRPEVISAPEAIVITMLAFLYTATNLYIYLSGLILLCTVALDFSAISKNLESPSHLDNKRNAREVGIVIMYGVYRCTVFGLLMIICMKIQAVYLVSSANTIVSWLISDAKSAVTMHDTSGFWLEQEALAQFTTFLLLFLTVTVFLMCSLLVYKIVELPSPSGAANSEGREPREQLIETRYYLPWWQMSGVVAILAANFFLLGAFVGFSIFLAVCVLISVYSLYDPMLGRARRLPVARS